MAGLGAWRGRSQHENFGVEKPGECRRGSINVKKWKLRSKIVGGSGMADEWVMV